MLLEASREEKETAFQQRLNVPHRVRIQQDPLLVGPAKLRQEACAHGRGEPGWSAQVGLVQGAGKAKGTKAKGLFEKVEVVKERRSLVTFFGSGHIPKTALRC
mgnify:CR=1 FL=1